MIKKYKIQKYNFYVKFVVFKGDVMPNGEVYIPGEQVIIQQVSRQHSGYYLHSFHTTFTVCNYNICFGHRFIFLNQKF